MQRILSLIKYQSNVRLYLFLARTDDKNKNNMDVENLISRKMQAFRFDNNEKKDFVAMMTMSRWKIISKSWIDCHSIAAVGILEATDRPSNAFRSIEHVDIIIVIGHSFFFLSLSLMCDVCVCAQHQIFDQWRPVSNSCA